MCDGGTDTAATRASISDFARQTESVLLLLLTNQEEMMKAADREAKEKDRQIQVRYGLIFKVRYG